MKNEKIEMTRDHIEPKRCNLWVVDIASVKREFVQSIDLPTVGKKKTLFGTKDEFGVMTLTVLEPLKWSYFRHFKETQDNGSVFEVTVSHVDPTGLVVEKTQYGGCTVLEIKRSFMTYESDDLTTTEVKIQPKSIEFLK